MMSAIAQPVDIDGVISGIHGVLNECKKNKIISFENTTRIESGLDTIVDYYEQEITKTVDRMNLAQRNLEVKISNDVKEYQDEVEQLKNDLRKEQEKRQNVERIRRGKILMRRIENDRFYTISIKYKKQLDGITIEQLLSHKNEKIIRTSSLNEHPGAKLAYSIICGEIIVPEIPVKFCRKYIEDNDEMHPDCKPLAKVIKDLRLFEMVTKTLDPDERKKYNIEPDIITEEIQFFIDTEKNST